MERRSDRIWDHCERATKRQVHEEEEPVAPQPRGRQNRGNHENHNRRHGHEQPLEDNNPIVEVEQSVGNDLVQEEEPSPPRQHWQK